jgi:hypothetical protein
MIDWSETELAVNEARGIAFDTCHKIYVLMDTKQVAEMREYEYELIHTSEEMTSSQMLETLKDWFEKSCPLRFIQAVETNLADPNAGFTALIEQGASDTEDCDDCGQPDCSGACEDEDEDEDEE